MNHWYRHAVVSMVSCAQYLVALHNLVEAVF